MLRATSVLRAAAVTIAALALLASCGAPFVARGELYEGILDESSERVVKYSSSGSLVGVFYQNFHRFPVERDTGYTVTTSCNDGGYAILVDESDGSFWSDLPGTTIPHAMGIGTYDWLPGATGVVTLRIYCREELLPVRYTILIE